MSKNGSPQRSEKYHFFSLEDVWTRVYRRTIEELEIKLSVIDLQIRLMQLYFCGHNLSDMLECKFFYRYAQFIGHGLCYETSALMMMTLRNNPTARIVRGNFLYQDKPRAHLWVEFYSYRHWWVLDPNEPETFITLRSKYYEAKQMTIVSRCRYLKFWSYPSVRKLYRKLQRPQTSYLFYELSACFRIDYLEATSKQIGELETLREFAFLDDPQCGTILIPHLSRTRIIYSRHLINEFMARPQRLRPKNHTLRQARSNRKYIAKVLQESSSESRC